MAHLTAEINGELFDEPISTYSRRQAIEDGVLVQLSGPGYVGDASIPAACTEASFKFPIAVTAEVFFDCIAVHKNAENACNDIQGRLWDVLWMLKQAIPVSRGPADDIRFKMLCVVKADSEHRQNRSPNKLSEIVLKALCGPGDDGEPVITIMWPEQD